MAIWQVEETGCAGRGFDADGILGRFKAWIVRAPAELPAIGGPGWYIIDDQSALGTDPYIVVCDVASPAVNDMNNGPGGLPPKFFKVGFVSTEAGFIRMQQYLWWNVSTHAGVIWCGHRLPTYDAASFEYRFRGGVEGLVVSARLSATWNSVGCLDWEGVLNRVEGTDKYGILQSGVTAGNDVILQLGTGQATKFTLNKRYYIFDFNGHAWVNYCKCTNVDLVNDRITVDSIAQNFTSGSVIASYAHRFFGFGTQLDYSITDINSQYGSSRSKIPYTSISDQSKVFHNQTGEIYGSACADYMSIAMSKENPDDDGNQSDMRPFIGENTQDNINTIYGGGIGNRMYGQVKNMYAFKNNDFQRGSDGKTTNGKSYVFLAMDNEIFAIYPNGSNCVSFLDTVSI